MSYSTIWTNNNPIIQFKGIVTAYEIIQSTNELCGDWRFEKMKYQIFDLLEIELLNVKTKENKIIASHDISSTIWNSDVKVAFIVKNKNHRKSILEYIDMMKNISWQFKLFENIEDAHAWCELGEVYNINL